MKLKERLVLVADDEKSFRDLIGQSLTARNYRVSGAGDGSSALRLARAERPELILLDLAMPRKNGAEVLRELRRGIQTRAIPVIMLSGSAEISDKMEVFALGADGYLTKPFDMEELVVRVDGMLQGNRRARSCDPLTRLPGSPMIEEEVNRRISRGKHFAFSRLDIDNFSDFNNVYGHEKGDELLLEIAGMLLNSMAEGGLEDDFAGHMGGDDFVAITSPERAEEVARAVTKGFDRAAARFLMPQSAASGAGYGFAPVLSIGIVSSVRRKLGHYAKVMEISAELIRYLKGGERAGRSAYLTDRRSDYNKEAKTKGKGSVF